jgi:hypothetical protein
MHPAVFGKLKCANIKVLLRVAALQKGFPQFNVTCLVSPAQNGIFPLWERGGLLLI